MNNRPLTLKPSPDKTGYMEEAHLAGLIALGLLLFLFEAYIPRPLPWLKLGLANTVTVIALYWYGGIAGLMVSLARIIIGSVFTGNFLTPGFLLSFGGGLLAVLTMIFFFKARLFGIWGISLAGAAAHNLGQILAGYFVLFENPVILQLLPYLILYSTISGTIVAMIGYALLRRIGEEFAV